MNIKSFVGRWEILGYKYTEENEFNLRDLQGVLFSLKEDGDVVWTVPYDLAPIPWFKCEIYEIYNINEIGYIIRFGTYGGHILEFKCDDAHPNEGIILTLKEWCRFYCKKIQEVPKERTIKTKFTLLPALQEKFFVDLSVKGCENVEFNCHSIIVKLLANEIPWNLQPFSEQPGFVADTILYYLYAESLPDTLSEYECYELIKFAKQFSCLDDFVIKCHTYEKKLQLSQKLRGLMADMQLYLSYIIDRFYNLEKYTRRANPKELCEIVKQSIKDAIIVGAKLALFCKLYANQKCDLTKHDENQIIRLTKFHLPIFMDKVRKLFEVISNGFGSLTVQEKDELAKHLVPEYEKILHKGSKVIRAVAKAIKEVIQILSPQPNEYHWMPPFTDVLEKSLKNILKSRELQVLEELYDHITCGFELILRKSEYFRGKSEEFKIRSVVYTLNEIVEELPIFVLRLEKVIDALDEKLDLNDFRFCFKVGTDQVAAVLEKMVQHRCNFDSLLNNFVTLLDRDEFTNSLICLGLLNQDIKIEPVRNYEHPCVIELHETLRHESFNLLESVCKPPLLANSLLSKKCLELFKSKIDVDMEFEVIASNGLEDSIEGGNDLESSESCIFHAHRIIMAARCYWFRRALLCDMKEAIDRKIVIHDTNPSIFQIFLEFLYSSQLDYANLTLAQLVELLLLSDRYEVDSLKQVCEYGLELNLDEDSVLYLLNVADQCNANVLKNNCIHYLLKNDEITHSDVFLELPIALQNEVFDKMWSYPSQNISNKQCKFHKGFSKYQKFDKSKTVQDGLSNSNF